MNQRCLEWTQNVFWKRALFQLLLHATTPYSVFLLLSSRVKFFTFLWGLIAALAGGTGIVVGSHRLYTHRSFKATRFFKIFLICCQTLAGNGSIRWFVRFHRIHQKFQDTNRDTSNINRGFFFAYVGSYFLRRHPECQHEWERLDLSDIDADPDVTFQKKNYKILSALLSFGLPTLVPIYFWDESLWIASLMTLLRIHMSFTYTGFSNYFSHRYGLRPYDGSLCATDNKFLNFYMLGEGPHNFHHTFPQDYRGHESNHLNFFTGVIQIAQKLGFVYDLKATSPEIIAARIKRTGHPSPIVFKKS